MKPTFTASVSSSVVSWLPYALFPLPLSPFLLSFILTHYLSLVEASLATLASGLSPSFWDGIPALQLAPPGHSLGRWQRLRVRHRTRYPALSASATPFNSHRTALSAPRAPVVSTRAPTDADSAPPPQLALPQPRPPPTAIPRTCTRIRALAPELHRALAPVPPAIAQLAEAPLPFTRQITNTCSFLLCVFFPWGLSAFGRLDAPRVVVTVTNAVAQARDTPTDPRSRSASNLSARSPRGR